MSIDTFRKSFTFSKTTETKKQVFGVAYPANQVDSQNEYTDSAELELAVSRVAELDGWPRIVDVQHDTQPTESRVIESYIATTDGPYFRKGDWLARIQVSDTEWPRIESGELKAFSIFGRANRETVTFQNKQVKKMTDIRPSLISLVKTGASRQSFVAKSDEAPAWFKAYTEKLDKRLAKLTKSDDTETGEPGDYVRKSDGWYRIGTDSTTLLKMDSDMNNRLELAFKQRADKLQKNDEQMEEHLHYLDLLHAVTGDSAEARAERASYANMASRHGGPDRIWKDAFDTKTGGDAHAQRNKNNPLHRYLSGWTGETKAPQKTVEKTAYKIEQENDAKRDKAFIKRMSRQ